MEGLRRREGTRGKRGITQEEVSLGLREAKAIKERGAPSF